MSSHKSASNIDDLLKKTKTSSALPITKETEPRIAKELPIAESGEKTPEKRLERARKVEQTIEVIPEIPTVDEDLQEKGVEVSNPQAIFVQNKKIQLPLELAKVDSGLHQPVTSGLRWLAELTEYILAKFHLVIKNVGGQQKIVEQN